MKKKLVAIILVMSLVFGLCAFTSFADEEAYPEAEAGGTYTVYVEEGGIVYYSITPDESGAYVFYTVSEDDTYMYLYDSDFVLLEEDDDSGDDLNAEIKYYLEAGNTYYIGLLFLASYIEGSFDFVCEKVYSAVSAQLILTTDSVELIQGIDSYTSYDENGDEYDYYNFSFDAFSEGDQIIIIYEDGSEETYTFEYDYVMGYEFYKDHGDYTVIYEDGYYMFEVVEEPDYIDSWYTEDSQDEEHWEVGGTYYLTLYLEDFENVSVTVPVTIVENPYVSAVFSSSDPLTIVQGLDSTIRSEGDTYYDYYNRFDLSFSEGDTITITDKDGEVIVFTYGIHECVFELGGEEYVDYYEGFLDEEGNTTGIWELNYDQSEEHWEVGGTYTVSIFLYNYGVSAEIPVTIVENPYSGATVTLNLVNDIILSECTDAYYEYDENGEKTYYYSLWNIEFSEGDNFIITFEDGTTETIMYDHSSSYSDFGRVVIEYYYFVDEDGNIVDLLPFSTQDYIHWTVGNTYSFVFYLFEYGICVEIPVTISDHDWELTEITAAACTEDGVITYTCADCGETKTDVTAASGHSWDSGVITRKATETENGLITYTCSICGDTYTEVIPAIGTTEEETETEEETDIGTEEETDIGTDDVTGTGSTDISDDEDENSDEEVSPEVGDTNSLALWFVLAFIAAAGICVYMLRRKFD